MTIIEAIETRRSVRSFDGEGLTDRQILDLQSAISEVYNSFGGNISIKLKRYEDKETFKPSTYGVIKNAKDYFLIGITNDKVSELSAGFCFEQVVLNAWQRGLGTCWLAATFKGSDFEKGESWENGLELRLVSPVGFPAQKSVLEKITRFAAGSDKRKPFSELFFNNDFNTPVSESNKFYKALEMLRLAPSSTNSQPWRVLVENNSVHFYYLEKSSLSVLDMGIGICHFYETEKYYNRSGKFEILSNAPVTHKKWKYLLSYISE